MTYATANKERCVVLARYLVENKATVRAVAAKFGISKSTVHKDITQTLRHVNPALYEQVKDILEVNKQERHLRGGEATKKKYHQKMAHTEG
jgi:putative DeoR family transcriptional regulator (stage III sporulation protein D)